jgi:hypothetical protein
MTILALDLGGDMGWAIAPNGNSVTPNTIDYGTLKLNVTNKTEGAGMRFFKLRCWLEKMHVIHDIRAVFLEDVKQRPASVKAGHDYGGYRATVTSWCEQHKIPYAGVIVSDIKKHAVGKIPRGKKGEKNPNKFYMVEAAQKRGFLVSEKDHNAVDAIFLLDYALKTHVN